MKITPVILTGGAGERLWPLSKLDYPKQFVAFANAAHSLFQEAVLRVADRACFHPPLIIGNEAHRFIIGEQLRAIAVTDATLIAEPVARNTAPALALAALHAPDALLLVMPSDHRIGDGDAFHAAVTHGARAAMDGEIVTFGVTPASAETGYGYIVPGEALVEGIHRIGTFVEKPEREVAAKLIAQGGVLNSGIFLLRAATALAALEMHAPRVYSAARAAYNASTRAEASIFPDAALFAAAPSISIDYAIMEHTAHGAVLPVSMAWSDLGSFTTLADLTPRDGADNALNGNVVTEDTSRCFVHSDGPLVATLGVSDLIVVAADNAVLVTQKDRTQDIKALLQQLRAQDAPDLRLTTFAHRPWGNFTRIDRGSNYQVKRLHLKPGAKISLQTHTQRSEHWIVVEGRATVTNGDRLEVLEKNQSTYIAAGSVHRLENREDTELAVIEVQTGDYLGEDDIVRLEDSYSRS